MEDIKSLKDKIKNLKVLFVDDEEQIREGTGLLLNKFFNNVTICSDGVLGLEAFTKNPSIDVIIADIQMPNMDGVEMVEKIKEIKKDVFVIFITASRGKADFNESLADMYITKPMSYDNIKEIINRVSHIG